MAKKNENKRCPLQKECGRKCEHVGAELKCDYYRVNGIGDNTIPDQEELRAQIERLKANEDFEAELAALPDEEEETPTAENRLVYLPIGELYPHPDNPRKDLGDLEELAESIKAKGVMQNLTVVRGHYITDEEYQKLNAEYSNNPTEEIRELLNCAAHHRPVEGGYTVIIGHRRMGASKLAGLTELPCVIVEMSAQDQIGTMLLENMQRSDLTVYEQATAFQMMFDFGESIESISEKTGFSKTTIRRRMKMTELNQDTLKKVSERQLSLMDFDRLSEIEDIKERNKVLAQIGTNNFENALATAISEQKKKANQKRWLEELKKYNATKIPDKDKWDSTKYVTLPYCSISADPVEKLKELFDGEGPFYYCMDKWGSIYLRKGKTQAETDEAMARQMEREQRDERNRQIRAALDEAFERAYTLRYDFVKGLSETAAKKNIATIAGFTAALGYGQNIDFESEVFADLMKFDVPKDPEDPEYDDEDAAEKAFAEAATNSPYYALLVIAYVLSDDSKRSNCYDWSYNYRRSVDLEHLYDFLTALGYEMSDEERELLNGESDLYVKPTPPAEIASASDEDEPLDLEEEEVDEDDLFDDEDEDPTDDETPEPEKDVVEQLKEMYGADE